MNGYYENLRFKNKEVLFIRQLGVGSGGGVRGWGQGGG